ncbi:MAG: tetratricopeptide repeat protein, partial [Planctomycetes bacterium]|nr:tetratricopeptide repeat protein [Planctomycetota bacterium]
RRVYRLPAEALAHGKENVLAVKVFNSQGLGGAVDVPMVLLTGPPLEVNPSTVTRHELTDYLDQMRRAGRLADAVTVLERILDERKSDPTMCALALGELTWVAHALGDDAVALAAFQRLSKDFPTHSCRRHAVRALCEIQDQRGSLSPFATPLEADLTTQGTWRLRYGNAGHILCSMVEYGSDLFGWPGRWAASSPSIGGKEPEGRPMDYQVFCSTFYRGPRPKVPDRWNWVDTWSDISAQDTKDPRALQNPTTRRRRCAWRNDGGWGHPFDNQGEDIILLLSIPPGIHTLSFYVLDWDWAASSRPRRQGFVADSDGTPLWAADADKFPAGKYLRMLLAGPRKLRVRVYKHDSACAALSGVFLDPAPRPLPSSLLSVGAPSGTAADAVRRLDALATGAGSIGDWLGDTGRAVIQQAASLREAAAQKTATDLLWLRWALWQTETFSCSTPRAVEAARQFAEALPRAVSRPDGLAVLRKLTDALFAQKRLAEAAALSAARANLLLAKPVTDESRAELEALALAWLDTDDETAVALFTRLASDLKSSLPPPEAVKALGDLGMKHFAQGRALKVNFTPGVRLFFPQAEPTPLPSFREVAWRTLESFGDKELIAKHAEKFVTAHVKQELDVSARVGSRAGAEKEPSVETARDLLKAVPGGHPLGERVQGSLVGRLVRTGMYEEAIREARAALAQGIQDPRERALVQSSLADALFRTGRVADAEKVWTELAAQPFDRFGTPAAMMSLMELYEARGQYDEAIATCRRLMEAQRDRPDMQKWTQERLERLETRARQQTKPTVAPPAAKAEEPPRTTFPAPRLLGDGHHPRLRPDGGAVAYVGGDGIVIAGTDGKPMATLPLPTEEKHATFGIEPE